MRNDLPSIALSGASELIKSYGQDPLAIATISELPQEALHSADLQITGRSFCIFLENAARACNQRFFGLEMAQRQGLQILGPIWLLMRNASSVGEAITSLAKNFLIHTDEAAVTLEQELGGISFCYEVLAEDLGDETQIIEHGLALTCLELKARLGHQWQPAFTQFRHSAPYNLEPLKKIFGGNIHFNQDRHAIHISTQDINKTFDAADTEHQKVLQRKLDLQLETTSQQIALQTEIAIRVLMAEEACQLSKVASAMAINPRTLQHYLKTEGLKFQELIDKVRLDMAKKYLTHSNLSVAAVAERLHFSETAAFTRFFKRMAGITPRQFIKQNK